MNTLFLMGNKRSGTSLLVQLLNLHEKVFITHESDVIWTLFQARIGRPDVFKPYPEDGPLGMFATLKSAAVVYQSIPSVSPENSDLVKAFFGIQEHLMKYGSDIQQRRPGKRDLAWIGDKKPLQHADPELRRFILKLFPDARFIHVVRNPCAVYRSIQTAIKSWPAVPDFWKGTAEDIFKQWLNNEKWVLQARNEPGLAVYSLRYEDIIAGPEEQMQKCFAWLGLEMTAAVKIKIEEIVREPGSANEPQLSMSAVDGLEDVMGEYGYKLDGSVRAMPG